MVVMCGVALEARELLMTGILSHEVLMTLAAARAHRLDAGFPEAEDLAGIAVTVYVRRSRTVAGLASFLSRMLALEQRLVGGIRDTPVKVIVTGLAGIGADVGRSRMLGRSRSLRPGHGCSQQGQKGELETGLTHVDRKSQHRTRFSVRAGPGGGDSSPTRRSARGHTQYASPG